MSFPVLLTDDAVYDLQDIYNYIGRHDSSGKADKVLARFEDAFASLSDNPQRGAYPSELLSLGIKEYREIFFKPYRIIYQISHKNVYILVIADGRRDLQALLQRRLLQP